MIILIVIIVLELKKYSLKGNFDRVSSLLLRAIEWKGKQLRAQDELNSRKELTGANIDSQDILQREWF